MTYSSNETPQDYFCHNCGADKCKLWRKYNTFADRTDLLCGFCAQKSQKMKREIDEDGKMKDEEYGHKTDQIGWFVPAVPTEDGKGYWGYTSVPEDGCEWWRRLRSLPL